MNKFCKTGLLIAIGAMLCWGVAHAALNKYQEKEKTIRDACKIAREKLTPQEQKQLQCSTPEIRLVSPVVVKPGETMEVAITGKFPAGTNFVFNSNNVEVVKEAATANSYRATVKVTPGAGPEEVSLTALTPVCCKSAYQARAIIVAGNFEWALKGANGWTVKAKSKILSPGERPSGELAYSLEFFRGSETTPFEKRAATLYPEASTPPSYRFSIGNQDESGMNVQQQMQAISKQLQNPAISSADQEKLMKQMQDMIAQMTKDAQKISDPAYIKQLQAKEQEFGCIAINLQLQNGAATGNLRCSEKVGRNIAITGTMKYLDK
jgi:hypothetical protein